MGKNIKEEQQKEKMKQIKKALKLFPQIVAEQEKRHREGKPFIEAGLSYEEIMKSSGERKKKRKVQRK